jgi:hypothetical protein
MKKKLYWQSTFGKIEIEEIVMKVANERLRPFSLSARVTCRSYSHHLQRVIVDFGADVSFQDAQKKILEHYKLDLPMSSIQAIVENHAKNIFEFVEQETFKEGCAQQIVVETDGSMVPVVDTAIPKEGRPDKRRCRSVRWQEARLCFARGAKQLTPVFYATMGSVDRTGDLLYRAALRVGFGSKTKVHGLGDGAKWIEDQMKRVFSSNVKYLVDFYHTSEYLAKAAEHSWSSQKVEWRVEQQNLLKASKHKEILSTLRSRLPTNWEEKNERKSQKKPKSVKIKEQETPVEACYRYILNREDCLDYKDALEKGLPIGSGEIESSHRYVIQKRLKIAGAWWKTETVEHMLSLRTLRANGDWDRYWNTQQKVS